MSLSDFSDLTDLSSSDEGDVPLATRAGKAKKGPKEYKITHVLRAPRTTQYTTKSLYDQIIDNAIDLDPEYQRDVVWQEEKQSGLIDSILRNYYIPPIIFVVSVQEDGSELRTCIDGKQRLTSIQRFFDGQIPHKDSFTSEKLWYKSTATGTKRKLLPLYLRTQFANKQVVCVEYTDLNGDQEREIFQRVQLGVALTPAERLQALVGPWSTVIREIQNQVLGEEGFEAYLDWGHARGRDFQCLATIGYLIESHPKTAIPGPKVLEKWLQKNHPVSSQLRNDLHGTFRIFVALARDKKYSGSLNRPTRVSPIEFIMIGVLIYLKRQTLSLTQISSAIEKMRKDVRTFHQDIRTNTRVAKHLLEFMAKKIKVSELKSDGEGDIPATVAIAKTVKPTKRKRPAYSDDSDAEPLPKAKPAKASNNLVSAEVVKSSNRASDAGERKDHTSVTKKAVNSNTSLNTASVQAPKPRTTNNSLSNFLPIPPTKSSFPVPEVQPPDSLTPLPPTCTANSNTAQSRSSALHSLRHNPSLTIQTGPIVKVGSHIGALNSPVALSAVDRLAPIRAAKATLSSPKTSVDPRPAVAWPRQSPPPSTVDPLQNGPRHSGPEKLEEALRILRSQHPQLVPSAKYPSEVVHPTTSVHAAQAKESAGHSMQPPSISGLSSTASADNSTHISQGNIQQRTHNENTSCSQSNPNQLPGSSTIPPRPSSDTKMSGNMALQHRGPSKFSSPTLPQRPQRQPVIPTAPRNSVRAEPISRSTSSEAATLDGRRGPYSKGLHRPPDERRRYDHSYDHDRDRRNWS